MRHESRRTRADIAEEVKVVTGFHNLQHCATSSKDGDVESFLQLLVTLDKKKTQRVNTIDPEAAVRATGLANGLTEEEIKIGIKKETEMSGLIKGIMEANERREEANERQNERATALLAEFAARGGGGGGGIIENLAEGLGRGLGRGLGLG
jgi:hypothetical protein